MLLQTVDVIAGAGKTYNALKSSITFASIGEPVIFVQPTKELISESFNDCQGMCSHIGHPILTRIDGTNTKDGQVMKRTLDHLKNHSEPNEILFLTHENFFNLPFFPRNEDMRLFVDEIPDAVQAHLLNLPENADFLLPHLDVTEESEDWYRLFASDPNAIKKYGENRKKDSLNDVLARLSQHLDSSNRNTYIKKTIWDKFKNKESGQFECFSVLNPNFMKGFSEVIMMGAMFEDSIFNRLYNVNGKLDFFRKTYSDIQNEDTLKLLEHTNGQLVTFKYFVDDKWTKYYRDNAKDDSDTEIEIMEFIKEHVKNEIGGNDIIWAANNDVPDNYIDLPNATRISNSPYGLNSYDRVNYVVFLSALNPPPSHYVFYQSRGIQPEEVRNAIYHQRAYQIAMKSSLRDLDSTKPVTVFVPDKKSAKWLRGWFKGSKIEKVDGFNYTKPKRGRPSKGDGPKSDAARQRKSRHAKKRAKLNKDSG